MSEAKGRLFIICKKKKNQDHCFLGMQKDDDSKDLRNACLVTELTKLHTMLYSNSDDWKHDWKSEKLNRK